MLSKIFIVLCALFLLLASLAIYQEYKPHHNNNYNNYESNTEYYASQTTHIPTIPERDEQKANETDAPDVLDFQAVFHPQDVVFNGESDKGPEIRKAFERYEVHTYAISWFDAVMCCWRKGGRLATPDDAAEAHLLGRLLQYTAANANLTNNQMKDAMYIGVSQLISGRPWTSVEGNELRFEWWLDPAAKYRLYSTAGKSCVAIINTGRFINVQCSSSLIYACDMKPPKKTLVKTKDDGYLTEAGVYTHPVKLHLTPLTWPEAQELCLKEGASLAAPTSLDELQTLTSWLFSQNHLPPEVKSGGIFIGFNDIAIESSWTDPYGSYSNLRLKWNRGIDDDSRAENCLVVMPSGACDDVPCGAAKPFACQKRKPIASKEKAQYVDVVGLGSYAVHVQEETWWGAVMICRSENATLAVPDSRREADVLTNLLYNATKHSSEDYYKKDKFYVGVHDADRDQIWRTLEGERVFKSDFNEWYGTRNMYADQRCALLMDRQFTPTYCENKYKFICKKTF